MLALDKDQDISSLTNWLVVGLNRPFSPVQAALLATEIVNIFKMQVLHVKKVFLTKLCWYCVHQTH